MAADLRETVFSHLFLPPLFPPSVVLIRVGASGSSPSGLRFFFFEARPRRGAGSEEKSFLFFDVEEVEGRARTKRLSSSPFFFFFFLLGQS